MTDIRREPVTGPSVWSSETLRLDSSWIHVLTDAERAELVEATGRVRARGVADGFERRDFPLPVLGERLVRILDELERGCGVALLRGLPLDGSEDDVHRMYWGILAHLGELVPQNAAGDLIGKVTDRGGDYGSRNTRGYTTRARLQPHCDITDVVGLLCVHPARHGGESHLSSAMSIYNEILRTHPEYLEHLYRGFHYDLRGEGVTDDPDEVTFNRVPVYSWHAGHLSCRYNGKSIVDGMLKAGQPLSGVALAAVQAVGELALRDDLRFDTALEAGDLQLLLNHTVLHGRYAYESDDDPSYRRLLLRAWVNTPHGRPLEPGFASRLNTGPRRGVFVRGAAARA